MIELLRNCYQNLLTPWKQRFHWQIITQLQAADLLAANRPLNDLYWLYCLSEENDCVDNVDKLPEKKCNNLLNLDR